MCAFHDIALQQPFAFTVLDHPDGCSSDDMDRLRATVSKFRRQSEIISAARQKISRDLSLTGKYTTKHRDKHVITREPGGAIRGSRVQRKRAQMDGDIDCADDVVADRGLGEIQSSEQDGQDLSALVEESATCVRAEAASDERAADEPRGHDPASEASADAAVRDTPSNSPTPGQPQLVYRWDLTNAISALIAKSEAFARSVKPHIVAAAEGAFSLKEIARRLDEQGIKTVTGKNWNNVVLSHVIQRGVIMGLEEYRQLFDRFITQPGRSISSTSRQRKRRISPS
jgi:hypothetical protein